MSELLPINKNCEEELKTNLPSRDEKIEMNLGLVHSCAHRMKGRGIEYDDLYSAGCIGLCKAIDRFEEERGLCFSTYAVPVILGEMRRLFRDGGAIKISRSLKELSLKVARIREMLIKKNGRDATISELASELKVEEADVSMAIAAMTPPMSLTVSDDSENGIPEADIRTDGEEEKIDDSLALRAVLSGLPPLERKLIIMRYFKEMTQTEIAKALGMTQVQVSRKEKKILEQLRKSMEI